MADYQNGGSVLYTGASGTVNFVVASDVDGTYFDVDSDNQVETGDVLGALTFEGTLEIPLAAGGTAEVFVFSDTGTVTRILLPGGTDPVDYVLPNSFDYADLNTGVFVFCFAAGTGISTPTGEVMVETLQIGDPVLTAEGNTTPVKWIGRQTVDPRFGPAERLHPVRIAAGALGNGVPHADLTVTADHALLIDGVLCHAGALVNGTTIVRVPMSDKFTVYHVETEAHDIILANGAPAETYIDTVGRRAFDNFAEFDALYGDLPEMDQLPFPRAVTRRQIPRRLQARISRTA